MPDFTQPVEPMFVALSIGAIFAGVGVGIVLVKLFKKSVLRKQMKKKQTKIKKKDS